MLKRCGNCGQSKATTEFNKNADKRDGLQAQCRECGKQRNNRNYRENGARRAGIRSNVRETRKNIRAYINTWLGSNPCVDCGETDIVVLDFDHVRGEKIIEVTAMIRQCASMARVVAEIAKCDVRCANCHRRATHSRRIRTRTSVVDHVFGIDETRVRFAPSAPPCSSESGPHL